MGGLEGSAVTAVRIAGVNHEYATIPGVREDVLDILLHLFHQKQGFVDLGHELNNRETGWVNGYLFKLKPDGPETFVVETVGSSVDKMAALREPQQ